MRICLDAGHSGPAEPGACSNGLTEAALNLTIALTLGRELAGGGHDIIYTRAGDIEDDGLAWRADRANSVQADLFLSIHCNAAVSSAAHGVEVYHYPASAGGRKLAGCLQQALTAAAYTADRGVKEADFAVLRLTEMPAALVEIGFLTSAEDRTVLASAAGWERIATALAAGIAAYAAGGCV